MSERKKEWIARLRFKDKYTGQWRKPAFKSMITPLPYPSVARRFLKEYKKELTYRDHHRLGELHLDMKISRHASVLDRDAAAASSQQIPEDSSPKPRQSS